MAHRTTSTGPKQHCRLVHKAKLCGAPDILRSRCVTEARFVEEDAHGSTGGTHHSPEGDYTMVKVFSCPACDQTVTTSTARTCGRSAE